MCAHYFEKLIKKDAEDAPDPLLRRLDKHADKRLSQEPGAEDAERREANKEYLRLELEMLHRYHRKGDSGIRVARAHTMIMDVMLDKLFNFAIATYEKEHGKLPAPVAMLALGGYGRMELSPHSDIDIMFLYPNRMVAQALNTLQETITKEILYPLWDLKLKIGHATRNIKECLQEARENNQSKNALLDARLISGSEKLFKDFQKRYKKFYRGEHLQEYLQEMTQAQKERRDKYGNTVYVQQPNIKNGVGGQRDFQNLRWMAFVRLGTNTLEGLCKKGYLSKSEAKQLDQAFDFLVRVRNELHFTSKRANDTLDLESQPEIAEALGYPQEDIFKRIEAFMHDYFGHTHTIYQFSKLLERRLAISDMPDKKPISFMDVIRSRRVSSQSQVDGFIIEQNEIIHANEDIFKDEPERLIRVFRLLQKGNYRMSLELEVLIRQSLHLINHKVIEDPSANMCFRSILQTVGNVYPTLLQMHELGVLGRFMPEFGKLTCLVQHEFYHLYTADIHTLRCIKELDDVFAEDNEFAPKYLAALRQTRVPALLYLILLVHDLGKAYGIKGHAERGDQIVPPILERMEIPKGMSEQILFIVRNHFEMARFTLNYDIDDPLTITSFSDFMQEPDLLRYLYVHNFCDARGTSHDLWNGYKDAVVTKLFKNTLTQLEDPERLKKELKEERRMIQKLLVERGVAEIPKDEIRAHFDLLPDRYFVNTSADEVELHIRMVNQLLQRISQADSVATLEPVVEWKHDEDRGLIVVHVVTWDRAGLFYKLAGAFTLADLSIISSKAISRSDHITIDTFYLVEAPGTYYRDDKAQTIFQEAMIESLIQDKDMTSQINSKANKGSRSLLSKPTIDRLQTQITPVVDIYQELSLKRTIIEIQTTDSPGLLYLIAKSIFDHGYDITFARISTERGAAIDAFYIEKVNAQEAIKTSSLMDLREDLTAIITGSSQMN